MIYRFNIQIYCKTNIENDVLLATPVNVNAETRTLRIRQNGNAFSYIAPALPIALQTYLSNRISLSFRPRNPTETTIHKHFESNFSFYLKGYYDLLRFNESHGLASFSPFILPASHIASHILLTPESIRQYVNRLRKGRNEMGNVISMVVTRADIDEDWVDKPSPRGGLVGTS